MQRRSFLAGCGAGVATFLALPGMSFGRTSNTEWLTGYANQNGSYGIARLDEDLNVTPLVISNERLHGIIRHPLRPEISAPSRRPGNQVAVLSQAGQKLRITAPDNRHYFGHGVYVGDGDTLFLTENDFETERGVLGIYDANDNYKRIGEIPSGGIGPHEIKRHPDGQHMIVANGGILTHPDSGRAKLNLDTMTSGISLINIETGKVVEDVKLQDEWHHLSIRHIDVTDDGRVVFGVQDQQRQGAEKPLLGIWTPGRPLTMFARPGMGWRALRGYVGSVSLDATGTIVAAACPRGGEVLFWDLRSRGFIGSHSEADVCGLAPSQSPGQFLLTSGQGRISLLDCNCAKIGVLKTAQSSFRFDNHCQMNA